MTASLSPTGRRALVQMLINEQRGTLTHRTAVHQSARIALEARGLIVDDGRHLTLTGDGIVAAHKIGVGT